MKNIGKIQMNAPVIIGFTVLSAFILLLGNLTGGASTITAFSVYRSDYHSVWFYVRIFGHVLGNTDWEVFVRNSLYILVLGPMLEEKYKSANLLVMMIITSLITGLIYALMFTSPLCGSECIVFMLMLLASMSVIKDKKIPLSFIMVIIIYICNVIAVRRFSSGDLNGLSGIIGGVCGAVFGHVMSTRKK